VYKRQGLKGGMVIFSTDINATGGDNRSIINRVKNWATTIYNRLTSVRRTKQKVYDSGALGMTIGRYMRGVYKDSKGRKWDENSLCVEVLYIDSRQLEELATSICREFKQEAVLVKDNNNGEIYFANREDSAPIQVASVGASN
jgi:hypothetical protein